MHFPGAFPPRRPSRHLTAAGSQVRDKTSASPKMASVQFFRPWRSGIRMFLSDVVPTVPMILGYCHVHGGVRLWEEGEISGTSDASRRELDDACSVAVLAVGVLMVSLDGAQRAAVADAAIALTALVDSSTLEAHMEDKYFLVLKKHMAKHRTEDEA